MNLRIKLRSSDCSSDGNYYNRDAKKDYPENRNHETPSATSREVFTSCSLGNIRNESSDVIKSSVYEKIKSFEKIRGNMKDEARRGDMHLYNLDCKGGLGGIKEKFALSTDQIRLNQREEKKSTREKI